MRKRAVIHSFVLVIIILGLVTGLYFAFPFMIASSISQKLNVKVALKGIDIKKNEVDLHGFRVHNPKDFPLKTAFHAKEICISNPFYQYLGNPLVINEIALEDIYVSLYISKDKKSATNWNDIISNMNKKKPHWYSIKRGSIVKKLTLTNVVLDIVLPGKEPKRLSPIKEIIFHDIDVAKGLPMKEISKIVVNKMISSLFAMESIKSIIGLPVEALEFLIKPFESEGNSSGPPPRHYPKQPDGNKQSQSSK